mmetsp:Transcript_5998/g.20265  ORF Transcript_5998/g.20265 Transcript_5998/m.20265 type:complete len:294 (+) Transcript_5998:4206-5087(+)
MMMRPARSETGAQASRHVRPGSLTAAGVDRAGVEPSTAPTMSVAAAVNPPHTATAKAFSPLGSSKTRKFEAVKPPPLPKSGAARRSTRQLSAAVRKAFGSPSAAAFGPPPTSSVSLLREPTSSTRQNTTLSTDSAPKGGVHSPARKATPKRCSDSAPDEKAVAPHAATAGAPALSAPSVTVIARTSLADGSATSALAVAGEVEHASTPIRSRSGLPPSAADPAPSGPFRCHITRNRATAATQATTNNSKRKGRRARGLERAAPKRAERCGGGSCGGSPAAVCAPPRDDGCDTI